MLFKMQILFICIFVTGCPKGGIEVSTSGEKEAADVSTVDGDTDVANTDVANTDVANTDVANTDVANTDVANTDIEDTGSTSVPVVCTSGYSKIASGSCVPTVVSCSGAELINMHSGIKTFNEVSDSYSSCVATSCSAGNYLNADTCQSVGVGEYSLDGATTPLVCTNKPQYAENVVYEAGNTSATCGISSVASCESGYSPDGIACIPSPFVFTIRTTTSNQTLGIFMPQYASDGVTVLVYDFHIDWGDGSQESNITAWNAGERYHQYTTPGDYMVTIRGTMEGLDYGTGWMGACDSLISVTDLGNLGWKKLHGAFEGCSNLVSFAGGHTPLVDDMSNMFSKTTNLSSLDLSSLNLSNVINIEYMFQLSGPAPIDMTGFNLSSVTSATYMFMQSKADSINLTNVNLSSVTDFSGFLFNIAASSLTLTGIDTSSATNMTNMFSRSIYGGNGNLLSLDVTDLDTAHVTNMTAMFADFSGTSITFGGNFDTSSVTSMNQMFSGADFTSLDLSNFNTSSVTNMNQMFYYFSGTSIIFGGNFDTSSVTDMTYMFHGASALSSLDLSNFDTSSVVSMSGMFSNTTSLTSLNVSGWDIDPAPTSVNMFNNSNPTLICSYSGVFLDGETCP